VSMAEHECLGRSFAINDEHGLVVCSWPKAKKGRMFHWLFSEFWTGLEYQAAALMLYEGLVREGVQVVRDVRERHDGRKRNPWNEPECGHHYARAMSSWAPLLALSGFQYSAPEAEMQFLPRVRTSPFRCFWSVGSAWGTILIDTRRRRAELQVLHGKLKLRTLRLPRGLACVRKAGLGGTVVRFRTEQGGGEAEVRLARALALSAGQTLALG